jgi:hypothetical protein
MNERIRQLAEQAREYATTRHPVSNIILSVNADLFEEKFAELIVRQCVKSTIALQNTAIDNKWELDETFHIIVDDMVEQFDMQHIFRS